MCCGCGERETSESLRWLVSAISLRSETSALTTAFGHTQRSVITVTISNTIRRAASTEPLPIASTRLISHPTPRRDFRLGLGPLRQLRRLSTSTKTARTSTSRQAGLIAALSR